MSYCEHTHTNLGQMKISRFDFFFFTRLLPHTHNKSAENFHVFVGIFFVRPIRRAQWDNNNNMNLPYFFIHSPGFCVFGEA